MNICDNYIALDLETTGVHPKYDRIIEIGALKIVDNKIIDTYKSFINPKCKLSEETKALTHIDDMDLIKAPVIEDKIQELTSWIGEGPLLGHNIIFDYSFLKRACVNSGLELILSGIDTLRICRVLMPPTERKTLIAASNFYGVDTGQSHRAFDDARATHFLYQKLQLQVNDSNVEAFTPKTLNFQIKKEQPASIRQKEHLRKLLNYHKIDTNVLPDSMTRNEISRMTDKIILEYGRIV